MQLSLECFNYCYYCFIADIKLPFLFSEKNIITKNEVFLMPVASVLKSDVILPLFCCPMTRCPI